MPLTKQQMIMVRNRALAKEARQNEEKYRQERQQSRKNEVARKQQLVQTQKKPVNPLLTRYMKKEVAQMARKVVIDPRKNISNTSVKKEAPLNRRDPVMENEMDPSEYFDDYGAKRRPPRPQKINLWKEVYRADQEKLKQEEIEARRNFQKQSEETQRYLQQQADYKKKMLEKEKAEAMAYHFQKEEELKKWKAEQKRLEKQREEKNKREKMIFRQVLIEKKQQRDLEKQMKVKAELKEVERAKNILAMEARELAEQKLIAAEKVERVKEENARMLEYKRQQRQKIVEEEKKMTEQYKAKLLRQEAEREEGLRKTYELQEKKVNLALLEVKSDAQIAAEDQARARIIQERHAKEEEEKYQAKQRARREANAAQVRALKVQQEHQRLRAIELAKENDIQASIWAKDTAAAKKQAEQKARAVRAKNWQHRGEIEKQIALDRERKANEDKYGMSELEMKINTQLLNTAGVRRTNSGKLHLAGNQISKR